jgi:ketosteroid isomerase-like protein
MSKENVRVVRDVRRLQARGRPCAGRVRTYRCRGSPSWDSTTTDVGRGHKQFLEFWHGWESDWDDYHVEAREFHDAGDSVVVVIYERGRGRLSGVAVEDEFAHLWLLRDGKVARIDVFTHKREALAAAGVRDGRG